jgi:hypothetical protein
LADPSLTPVLYAAQLEEFRKNLTAGTASPGGADSVDGLFWIAGAVGVLLVLLTWWIPWHWWEPHTAAGRAVDGPDTVAGPPASFPNRAASNEVAESQGDD